MYTSGKPAHYSIKVLKVHTSGKPFKFTYNFKENLDLTEDRTLKYAGYTESYLLPRLLAYLDKDEVINALISCGNKYVEYGGDYSSSNLPEAYR